MTTTRTEKAERTRARILDAALSLFEEHGYERTTTRRIATTAGVSVGLVYRYFGSKEAFILAFYDRLSNQFAERARSGMRPGDWKTRFMFALRTSLDVLGPHRELMRALFWVMLNAREGLYPPTSDFSKNNVQRLFRDAVMEAENAPTDAEGLAQTLYVIQLLAILFWLLDRTEGTRATTAMLAFIETCLPAYPLLSLNPLFGQFAGIVESAVFGDQP